jgi:acyl-CoA synthetase (AMP-forming)/AMP-acid ligase II
MLYERWRQIAQARLDQIALRDLAAGRCWTFAELAALTEERFEQSGPIFPAGEDAGFVLSVLGAWRGGRLVCPLEPGQDPPAFHDLPLAISHIKTTSATTGSPRYVLFTESQLMADADNIVRTMGMRPGWPNLGVISLSHSYGFSNLVLPLLLHGIPLILVGSALPEAVRRAAAGESDVTLAAVPALWRMWHGAGAIPSNVRLAISAAAPFPLALEQQIFEKTGLKVHNFYGSTECGGIAYDSATEPRRDETCAGVPMSNVELFVDAGCLVVRSDAVGYSYWPETAPNLGRGVFRTNDLAAISDGHVYLQGRAGDQINVAGRKVSPEVIESALASHPQVRECMAFGVPSKEIERGETIVACLQVEGVVSGDSLRQFLIAKLPAWQVPRDWWFVDSLQANHRGKISRADWRKRYLEKRTAA